MANQYGAATHEDLWRALTEVNKIVTDGDSYSMPCKSI